MTSWTQKMSEQESFVSAVLHDSNKPAYFSFDRIQGCSDFASTQASRSFTAKGVWSEDEDRSLLAYRLAENCWQHFIASSALCEWFGQQSLSDRDRSWNGEFWRRWKSWEDAARWWARGGEREEQCLSLEGGRLAIPLGLNKIGFGLRKFVFWVGSVWLLFRCLFFSSFWEVILLYAHNNDSNLRMV